MNPALLTLLTAASLFAQTGPATCATVSPAAAKLEFDAAVISRGPYYGDPLDQFLGGPGTNHPDHMTAPRVSLSALIAMAWDLQPDQVSGPDWMKDTVNSGFAIDASMPATTNQEAYCGMLRNLLTTRFHLTFHRVVQPREIYELTVLPGGSKLHPDEPGSQITQPIIAWNKTGLTTTSFRNQMAVLANYIADEINAPNDGKISLPPHARVVDKTNLSGIYNIRLEFAGKPKTVRHFLDPKSFDVMRNTRVETIAPVPGAGPDIFNALQQQLNLLLQRSSDISVDVLIIDHADQTPTEN